MVLLPAGELAASSRLRLDTLKTELQVRRPALEPVKSLDVSPARPIDTLDTVNEHVKVVLFSDNTWQYYKLPTFEQKKDVFESFWDTEVPNPYKMSLDSLPYSWSIWLVDSLDQYHCPYQGDVHPRGKFGPRRGRRHQGVDIPLKTGELRHRLFILKKRYFNIYSNYEQDFEDEWKNEEEDKKEDAERAAMRWHTVRSGDTLGRIAINNGTTVSAICKLNGITPKTVLKIGRRLRVR